MFLCKHVGYSSPLEIVQRLDHIEWGMEDPPIRKNIDESSIGAFNLEKDTCSTFLEDLSITTYIPPVDQSYIKDKFFRLTEKMLRIVPVASTISHESLAKNASAVSPPLEPSCVIQQEIFSFSRQLDLIYWAHEDQLIDHPVSGMSLCQTKKKMEKCYHKYLGETQPKIFQLGIDESLRHAHLHVDEKYHYLQLKLRALDPIEPISTHRQYIHRNWPSPTEQGDDFGPESAPEEELLSMRLKRMAPALCYGSDTDVLQALDRLPFPLQESFFNALWIVRGRPSITECMGHKNFGEILLTSTPQQRGCAIEIIKLSLVFSDLISILNKNDLIPLRARFADVPVHIQNEIFRKHWEQMGSPTSKSPDQFLRKMAHQDFGRVSFLGLEARCEVSPYLKVKTLETYLIDFSQKIATAQAVTEQIKGEWNQLDLSEGDPLEKKIAIKKENLQQLATTIVPQFEGKVPQTFMSAPTDSYHAVGKAYVETYPWLKPFFLQLMNNL